MALEIERKFLLASDSWRDEAAGGTCLKQGYLSGNAENAVVRVRIAGEKAFLTIKGRASGIVRQEFEYEIPYADAEALLSLCSGFIVEKVRYTIPAENGMIWEIDDYCGVNAGLTTAEIELPSAETEFIHPEWLGSDISNDYRYSNSALSENPFSQWDDR